MLDILQMEEWAGRGGKEDVPPTIGADLAAGIAVMVCTVGSIKPTMIIMAWRRSKSSPVYRVHRRGRIVDVGRIHRIGWRVAVVGYPAKIHGYSPVDTVRIAWGS